MISPGRYRHFKNGDEYRVLLVAMWSPYGDPPSRLPHEGQYVFLIAYGVGDPPAAGLFVTDRRPGEYDDEVVVLDALWAGKKPPTLDQPEVVIYCNPSGVYARALLEFDEQVNDGTAASQKRFTRVGP